jgi:hypothetical protein
MSATEVTDNPVSTGYQACGQIAETVMREMSTLRHEADTAAPPKRCNKSAVELLDKQIEVLESNLGRALIARAQIAALIELTSTSRR